MLRTNVSDDGEIPESSRLSIHHGAVILYAYLITSHGNSSIRMGTFAAWLVREELKYREPQG